MSFFKTTPLREPRMEDQCGQKLNFEVPIESEPILKRKRVPWSSKYQANTCDVGRAGDVDSVKDDSENPYSVSQADRFHVVSSGMAPVFATNDLNSVSGTYLDSSQVYQSTFLSFCIFSEPTFIMNHRHVCGSVRIITK